RLVGEAVQDLRGGAGHRAGAVVAARRVAPEREEALHRGVRVRLPEAGRVGPALEVGAEELALGLALALVLAVAALVVGVDGIAGADPVAVGPLVAAAAAVHGEAHRQRQDGDDREPEQRQAAAAFIGHGWGTSVLGERRWGDLGSVPLGV